MSRVLVDSGIDWIGKIPNNWNLLPLRSVVENINEKNNPIKFTNILSLTNKLGVVPYEKKGNQGNISKEDITQYKIAYKDTVVLNSMNLKIGSVGYSNYDGCVSPVYYVLKSNNKSNMRFINYVFQSDFQKYLGKFGKGILEIREKISMYDVLHSYIPVPNMQEQKRIVDYLGEKCLKLDEIIKDNNHEIELLEEYKKNIFTDVINKYEIKYYKLKYIIANKLQYGANSSGVEYNNDLPRYVRITDILNNDLKNTDKLSLLDKDAIGFILNDGDILFARSGGTVGKSFIYKKKYGKCAFAGYLIRAQFVDKELSQYVYNYTNSTLYDEWKKTIFIQSTIQNIGADKYSIMPVPIPTDKKNLNIINLKIKIITNKLDKVIEYRKQIIEKLEEYKKSLIYECVTGKREV